MDPLAFEADGSIAFDRHPWEDSFKQFHTALKIKQRDQPSQASFIPPFVPDYQVVMLLVILEKGNGSSIRERERRLGRFDLFHVVDSIRLIVVFGENRGSDNSLSKSMLELHCSIFAIVVVVVITAMEIIVNVGHHIIDGVRP